MTFKSTAALIVAGLMTLTTLAQETFINPPAGPPDKQKLSYAMGMRMGLQLKQAKLNVDVKTAVQAIQDVLGRKPTLIKESEIPFVLNQARSAVSSGQTAAQDQAKYSYAGGMRLALFFKRTGANVDPQVIAQAIQDVLQGKSKMTKAETASVFMQEEAYQTAQKSAGNKAAGEAFLAKNAHEPGVTLLSDGLEYKVIEPGTGPLATTNDFVFIKFRGTSIGGAEFDHHDHFLTRINGGLLGWREVLPQMRTGSQWRIFLPPDLAFGEKGENFHGVGPDSTVIYDLELVSIAPPDAHFQVNSGLGHGLDIGNSGTGTSPSVQ